MDTYLKVRTKGNASPMEKPRVYFSCHPLDFDRYFTSVCEMLFKSSGCAVYYYEDMKEEQSDILRSMDLEQMNLFVILVTGHLLLHKNRTLDEDLPFAVTHNIPILPLMMESGLEELYDKKEIFTNRQYLEPYHMDPSAIPFEKKLEDYLDRTLTNEDISNRVRESFLAYLFLSYRKKDRLLANELMRQIHSMQRCRDIAIWYDEYLIPGEDFNETIAEALNRSSQFILLVTPSLLENNNYIQQHEYPMARRTSKPILAVEGEETDLDFLRKLYKGIPDPIDVSKAELIQERVVACLSPSIQMDTQDMDHLFLMGVAYLYGIHVEVDRPRGVELITEAASNGNTEAMEKLRGMYYAGTGVPLDYEKSLFWADQLVKSLEEEQGNNSKEVLRAKYQLALHLQTAGRLMEARTLLEDLNSIYGLQEELSAEQMMAVHSLAKIYCETGDVENALEIEEALYQLLLQRTQPEDSFMMVVMSLLASCYSIYGNIQKAIDIQSRANEICLKLHGSESVIYWEARCNLAEYYMQEGHFQDAYQEMCEVVEGLQNILGEENPLTLRALVSKARAMDRIGKQWEALKLSEAIYKIQCRVLGDDHVETISTLGEVAHGLIAFGKYRRALKLEKVILEARQRTLVENHINILATLGNIAFLYEKLGRMEEALALSQEVYEKSSEAFGSENPYTLIDMENLANRYKMADRLEEAMALQQEVYDIRSRVLGREHPDTIRAFHNLGIMYAMSGKLSKAITLQQKAYEMCRSQLGEEHPLTLTVLDVLVYDLLKAEEVYRVLELSEKLYSSTAKLYGDYDKRTLSALYAFASSNIMLNHRSRALELYEKYCAISEAVSGTIDYRTEEALKIVSFLKVTLGGPIHDK